MLFLEGEHGRVGGADEDEVTHDRYVFLYLAAASIESDDVVHGDVAFHSDFVEGFLDLEIPAVCGSHRVPDFLFSSRHTSSALTSK